MNHATHADGADPITVCCTLPHSPGLRGSACLDALEQSFACTTEDFAAGSSRPPTSYCTRPGSAVFSIAAVPSPDQSPGPPPGLHVRANEILDAAPLFHDRRVERVARPSWPSTQPQRDLLVRQRQPMGRRGHHPSATEHGISAPENTGSLLHPVAAEPGLTPLRTHSLPVV